METYEKAVSIIWKCSITSYIKNKDIWQQVNAWYIFKNDLILSINYKIKACIIVRLKPY